MHLLPTFEGHEYFTTEMVAAVLEIQPWRIIKFIEGKEYGIKPLVDVEGSGRRRLYIRANIVEIALALRLLEIGLRPKVIGNVLKQIRALPEWQSLPEAHYERRGRLTLCILRLPETGKLLKAKREQLVEVVGRKQLGKLLESTTDKDAVIIDLESMFDSVYLGLVKLIPRLLNKEI